MIDEPIFWNTLKSRYEALVQQLTASSLEAGVRHKLQKEFSFLSTILEKRDEIRALEQELHELEQQAQDTDDAELKELFDEELEVIRQRVHKAQEVLDELLYPEDELDQRAAFIEIRPGAGGQEASLFVGDLMRMYTNYALKKGWRVVPINLMPTDIGGYKEVILEISGKGAYGSLKHEAGVHRVQRVPATEASGRIHTSTATVAVLPEAQEIEITLDPADVRIDVFRASGAGGQHVNTTDSAVRLTHIPTGIVVSCQDERSQHKNKAKALKILQSRLLAADRERKEMEARKVRKEMVGTGMRAEKVRTYNFPQNRVTDHQVNITLKNLDMVLEGDLDDIIDALLEQERTERRKRPFEFFT